MSEHDLRDAIGLRGLVVDREPDGVIRRLDRAVETMRAGRRPTPAQRAVLSDLHHRYGRELAELRADDNLG
jgi:hypothetical protein